MPKRLEQPFSAVTEERIGQWAGSLPADLHDAATEIRRLQARERQLLEVSKHSLALWREAEATAAIRDVQIAALERYVRVLLEPTRARACMEPKGVLNARFAGPEVRL